MANKIQIEFESNNAAFEDNPEEAANILNYVAEIVRQRGTGVHSSYESRIKDSYGNSVGTLKVNKVGN